MQHEDRGQHRRKKLLGSLWKQKSAGRGQETVGTSLPFSVFCSKKEQKREEASKGTNIMTEVWGWIQRGGRKILERAGKAWQQDLQRVRVMPSGSGAGGAPEQSSLSLHVNGKLEGYLYIKPEMVRC